MRLFAVLVLLGLFTSSVAADIPPPPPPKGKKYVFIENFVAIQKAVYVFFLDIRNDEPLKLAARRLQS